MAEAEAASAKQWAELEKKQLLVPEKTSTEIGGHKEPR